MNFICQITIPLPLAERLRSSQGPDILKAIEADFNCKFDTSDFDCRYDVDQNVPIKLRATCQQDIDRAMDRLLELSSSKKSLIVPMSSEQATKIREKQNQTSFKVPQCDYEWLDTSTMRLRADHVEILDSAYENLVGLINENRLQPENNQTKIVIIDADNVCMTHGIHRKYSARGLEIAIKYFRAKYHHLRIRAIIPRMRFNGIGPKNCPKVPQSEIEILNQLDDDLTVVDESRRLMDGARVKPHDDRVAIQLLEACRDDAILVSNDVYRDMAAERNEWKKLLDERRFNYMFIEDHFFLLYGRKQAPPDELLAGHN